MVYGVRVLLCIAFILFTSSVADAQDDYEYETPVNASIGAIVSAPLNPSARFVNYGWGLTTGAGYTLTRHHALIGEFMWNKLYPTSGALQPVLVAFNQPKIAAYTNVLALTANYRYEPRGRESGVYFIGGGGLYYRNADVKHPVPIGPNVPCAPAWTWWGYTCNSGFVSTSNLVLNRYNSTKFGVNGGIGFTIRGREESYRFYVETRYHYAPSKEFNTQILDVTVGFRY